MYATDDEYKEMEEGHCEDHHQFKCILVIDQGHSDSMKYSLDLPTDFVDDVHPHLGKARNTFVAISNGRPVWEPESMQPPSIAFPVSATITVADPPDHDRWHLETRESQTHGHKTFASSRLIILSNLARRSSVSASLALARTPWND